MVDPYSRAYSADVELVRRAHRIGYQALRLSSKIGRAVNVPKIGLIVSDAALIREILLDSTGFKKTGPGSSGDLWTQIIGPHALMNMEGTAHANLKRLLNPLFAPSSVMDLLEADIEPQLVAMKNRLLDGETIDLVREIELSTGRLVCRFAGFDETVGELEVVAYLARARAPLGLLSLRTRSFSKEQVEYIRESFAPIEKQTRLAFREQIVGTIPNLLREFGLNEDDAYAVAAALILTSTETVIAHIPRFIALLLDSGEINKLLETPNRLDGAIQEGFRVCVPSPVMLRVASGDSKVNGHSVKKGTRVILSNYMAQQVLGEFKPDRSIPKEMRQLWFGAGPHFCIGMPLATRLTTRYTEMLLNVHGQRSLQIVSREPKLNTLAAGYRTFLIRSEQ